MHQSAGFPFCGPISEFNLWPHSLQSDSTGKLGFHEFKYLWNNIKKWQVGLQCSDCSISRSLQFLNLIFSCCVFCRASICPMTLIAQVRSAPRSCQMPSRRQVRNPACSIDWNDQKSPEECLTPEMFPGFPLNDQLFKLIIRRYCDQNGDMDFDNFIGCVVRLDAMCRKSFPTYFLWSPVEACLLIHSDLFDP